MLKESIRHKLESLVERHQEIAALLSEADIINNQQRYRDLSKEYSELQPLTDLYQRYVHVLAHIEEAKVLASDADPSMRELAQDELKQGQQQQEQLEKELQLALIPHDPNDDRNVFLEIRAGAGGDEASIFAGDLFRMYARFAEGQHWRVEILSESFGEHGGYKEIISKITGQGVYSKLKFESGVHRVQRVPATEAQGRIHTSTCTVAVLPEVEEIEAIQINPADLRVDTYRASGAGGQHVNKTDSAIRLTHLPTGIVVECQDERSQHKNRAKALSLLHSKILSMERAKQQGQQAQLRRDLVGSGDRSERIRTYNYPQGRVTEHRINLTLYKLPEVMEGDLHEIIQSLMSEHQADQLALISDHD